ncbi:unnamed protein product [Closterium sp. Naga37s-1]|nr:unnamed protein product [Closterium sp. Naga37s-1]
MLSSEHINTIDLQALPMRGIKGRVGSSDGREWNGRVEVSDGREHGQRITRITCSERGPGVVGQQPVLPPGASFEYTSVCPLDTRNGAMEGEFEMVDVATSAAFEVKIGEFALDVDQDGF